MCYTIKSENLLANYFANNPDQPKIEISELRELRKFIEKQLDFVKEFWFEFSKMHNDLYRNYARLSQLMLENPSDAPKYAEEIKILKGSTRVKIMMMRGYKLFLTKRTGDVLEKYFSGIDTENALDQMFDPSLDKIYYELFESLRKDIANLMSREMKINDYFL
jgi:hypothetical protein